MEHLNRACKDSMCGLGANKTPAAMQRIGKCIGVLKAVSDNYDEQSEVGKNKGYHTVAPDGKDKELILKELHLHKVFSPLPGRSHSSFKHMECSIFSKVKYGEMVQWMKEHTPT